MLFSKGIQLRKSCSHKTMLWKNKLTVLHLILFRAKSRWKHSFVRFKFGTVAIQTKWFLYFLLSKTSVWLCFHSSNSVRKQWIYWTSRHVDTEKKNTWLSITFLSVIGRFQHLLKVVKCLRPSAAASCFAYTK